ncbi:MAG: hypothetical protein Q9225_007260 [Loekoesia sp. 1 TL-2023]
MSASVNSVVVNPDSKSGRNQAQPTAANKNYRGFVAGVFSGIAKLSGPYISKSKQSFSVQSYSRTYLAIAFNCANDDMADHKHMLGSLTFYRRILKDNVFSSPFLRGAALRPTGMAVTTEPRLPAFGHGIAGIMAGWTVSFIAAPIEHIKARLQIQYSVDKSKRLYSGPIDCCTKILRAHGFHGIYHGLAATLLFRSFFFFWWGSYDILTKLLSNHTALSAPAINFWAGGLSAQVFWITSYPSDVVKQRIMTDPLGGNLGDGNRRFFRWKDAAKEIWQRDGVRGYWRGFLPCFMRAFPANATALVAFEAVMRALPE